MSNLSAAGLRRLADILDAADAQGITIPTPFVSLWSWNETGAPFVKLMARETKTFKKEYIGSTFSLETKIEGIDVVCHVERSAICKKVETEVVIPAKTYPASEAFTVPERVEKKVEWVCEESLLS